METSNPMPGGIPSSDAVLHIWENIATALATNDSQALSSAISDIATLSSQDKELLNELIAMLPPPWIPPMMMTSIFSNPDETIGLLSRLTSEDKAQLSKFFGVIESSIVLSVVVSWLQSQSKEAQAARDSAENAIATENPINVALKAYIQNAQASTAVNGAATTGTASSTGVVATVSAEDSVQASPTSSPTLTQSMQYLRDNPILLASMQTANPNLLLQAFQIAESQIMIACLDRIIASQDQIKAAQIEAERRNEAITPSPGQTMTAAYLQDIKSGKLPLTQTTMMVFQGLLIGAGGFNFIGATTPATEPLATAPPQINQVVSGQPVAQLSPTEFVANATAIASTSAGAEIIATNDVNKSWNSASVTLFPNDTSNQIGQKPELVFQLGMLASVYAQMAPYWSIPAAVSLLQATPPPTSEKMVTEAAVRAFAVAIGTLISAPEFTLMLRNLITQNVPRPEALTEEQINTYVSALKVTLLLNALVAVKLTILRKTGGQFSAHELRDLIMGKIPLPTSDDLETGLIRQIQVELANIPEAFREEFLNALLSSYSDKTNIEALIDPSKQFLRLCDQSLFRSLREAEGV